MSKLKEINSKFYQECEVLLLTTDKNLKIGDLGLSESNILWYIKESNFKEADVLYECKPHYLYIISDEEIKDGFSGYAIVTVKDDPRIHYLVDVICAEKNQCYCREDRKFSYEFYSVKPIIATTDTSLKINNYSDVNRMIDIEYCLPQPSKEFVNSYLNAYNINNPITKVMVEIERKYLNNGKKIHLESYVKTNSSNEITIKKIKDNYTRAEYYKGIKHAIEQAIQFPELFITGVCCDNSKIDSWVENNI